MAEEQKQQEEQQQSGFVIQRIYLKDCSFESPASPEVFLDKWEPEVSINLHTASKALKEDAHEVVLKITVTATQNEKTVFVAEVHQAGIFTVSDMPKEQIHYLLGAFCPNMLFPYARETIGSLVGRGEFPHFYLQPVDFDQIYQQHLAEEKKKAANEAEK